ncbi:MAG: hypothetical protein WCP26_12920 [Actinomycetes bacterium]
MAEALTDHRHRRMRHELRQKLGSALRVRVADRDRLDAASSPDVFVVLLPESRLTRAHFADQRPLLRQALVAGCAATETYLADKVMTRVSSAMPNTNVIPSRLAKLPLTVGEWLFIEEVYQVRRRGLREHVIEPFVRINASTAPNKFGESLSLIGLESWSKKIDSHRGVRAGTTVQFLERVTTRRNKIAHTGDRQGYGRAKLTVQEVKDDLAGLESIVDALEAILAR